MLSALIEREEGKEKEQEKYLDYFWLKSSDVLDLSSQKQNNPPSMPRLRRASTSTKATVDKESSLKL